MTLTCNVSVSLWALRPTTNLPGNATDLQALCASMLKRIQRKQERACRMRSVLRWRRC